MNEDDEIIYDCGCPYTGCPYCLQHGESIPDEPHEVILTEEKDHHLGDD